MFIKLRIFFSKYSKEWFFFRQVKAWTIHLKHWLYPFTGWPTPNTSNHSMSCSPWFKTAKQNEMHSSLQPYRLWAGSSARLLQDCGFWVSLFHSTVGPVHIMCCTWRTGSGLQTCLLSVKWVSSKTWPDCGQISSDQKLMPSGGWLQFCTVRRGFLDPSPPSDYIV